MPIDDKVMIATMRDVELCTTNLKPSVPVSLDIFAAPDDFQYGFEPEDASSGDGPALARHRVIAHILGHSPGAAVPAQIRVDGISAKAPSDD